MTNGVGPFGDRRARVISTACPGLDLDLRRASGAGLPDEREECGAVVRRPEGLFSRTAYPSIADLSNAGTGPAAVTSPASTRPLPNESGERFSP